MLTRKLTVLLGLVLVLFSFAPVTHAEDSDQCDNYRKSLQSEIVSQMWAMSPTKQARLSLMVEHYREYLNTSNTVEAKAARKNLARYFETNGKLWGGETEQGIFTESFIRTALGKPISKMLQALVECPAGTHPQAAYDNSHDIAACLRDVDGQYFGDSAKESPRLFFDALDWSKPDRNFGIEACIQHYDSDLAAQAKPIVLHGRQVKIGGEYSTCTFYDFSTGGEYPYSGSKWDRASSAGVVGLDGKILATDLNEYVDQILKEEHPKCVKKQSDGGSGNGGYTKENKDYKDENTFDMQNGSSKKAKSAARPAM